MSVHAEKEPDSVQIKKERLVLMPLRVGEEELNLRGAMETALAEGLQKEYKVFSGEQVAQKAREIFLKESRSTDKKECDETRCMQGIAEAFKAELIATANVTKKEGGYFLALSIQNIFDNKVVYSRSIACQSCNAFQVVDKLKELSATVARPTSSIADNTVATLSIKPTKAVKERLVLMPLRLDEEDKSLQGAMETALTEGLQLKYEVFSGEQVAQKAREIFLKESRNTAKKECDETRCMQGIAEAFQAELIATANVTKKGSGYFLALSIQNIFDNLVVYSKSLPCEKCSIFKVVSGLKELSGLAEQETSEPVKQPVRVINSPNF